MNKPIKNNVFQIRTHKIQTKIFRKLERIDKRLLVKAFTRCSI